MKKPLQIAGWIALAALLTVPCRAADSAILRNGFSIRHERRQIIGTITRLFMDGDNSSFVDIPTAEIDHFETLPDDAAPMAQPKNDPIQVNLQPSKANIPQPLDLNEVVKAASGTYNLDPDLVNSVIRAESGFNVRAVSPKGAQGLMQLMPKTASQLGVQNAFDPQANVEGGTRYLRELLERYNFDLIKALAAYNAGPERVEQYGGVPPYYETKAYVARIVRDFNKKKLAAKAAEKTTAKPSAQPAAKKSSVKKSGANHGSKTKSPKSIPQTEAKVIPAQSSE
jgi:soluble lytic murein transglycosylase-like protein